MGYGTLDSKLRPLGKVDDNILDLRIKKDLGCPENVLRNITKIFKNKLGNEFIVNINPVDKLISTFSEKQAFVINYLDNANFKE
tara:strand:+ start:156 stop:407 length:252 start_codon:yes stop_codon:yes gene_type:complete